MKLPNLVLGLCVALSLLAVPGDRAHAQSLTIAMPKGAHTGAINFKPFGQIAFAVAIKNASGRLAVCGMWAETKRLQAHVRANAISTRWRGALRIYVGQQRVMRGAAHFTEVREEDFKAGTTANCRVTTTPWQAGFSNKNVRSDMTSSRGRN